MRTGCCPHIPDSLQTRHYCFASQDATLPLKKRPLLAFPKICGHGHPLLIGISQSWFLGEGNGTPLQYFCLENPVDGGAWWAAVRGVAKSRTRLSNFTFTFHFHALEKEMATHSSVLAWSILGMGSLVGYCLWGRTESDTTEVT